MGLIAIGDIHGCNAALGALLDELAPTADDHLVFVGDYVDRGPDSRGVIERLIRLREERSCTFLRGNHEAMMLEYLDTGALELWRLNGGLLTLNNYLEGGRLHLPDEHVDFVRDTLPYYETERFLFVHAGLKPHLSVRHNLERYGEEVFLWERSHLTADRLEWEKTVVCGHTPHKEPLLRPELICIDTGCVFYAHEGYGRLTAVRLPERALVMSRCG